MKNPYRPFEIDIDRCELKCDSTSYKWNTDKYSFFKKCMFVLSLALIVICLFFIIFCEGWLQVVASSLFGGMLSMIVWLISMIHTDKMNGELSQIDANINAIDDVLIQLRMPIEFYDIDTLSQVNIDKNDIHFKNVSLLQMLSCLKGNSRINSEGLIFKWFDKNDCKIDEYISKAHGLISNSYVGYSFEVISNVIDWNRRHLEIQLLYLRHRQLECKVFVTCGNVPVPIEDMDKQIKKAKLFDKFFNRGCHSDDSD